VYGSSGYILFYMRTKEASCQPNPSFLIFFSFVGVGGRNRTVGYLVPAVIPETGAQQRHPPNVYKLSSLVLLVMAHAGQN
jgi:hypothetical protein